MSTDYTLLVKQVSFEKLKQAIASVSLPPGVCFNAYDDADFVDDYYPLSQYPLGVSFWSKTNDAASELTAGKMIAAALPAGSSLLLRDMQQAVA